MRRKRRFPPGPAPIRCKKVMCFLANNGSHQALMFRARVQGVGRSPAKNLGPEGASKAPFKLCSAGPLPRSAQLKAPAALVFFFSSWVFFFRFVLFSPWLTIPGAVDIYASRRTRLNSTRNVPYLASFRSRNAEADHPSGRAAARSASGDLFTRCE